MTIALVDICGKPKQKVAKLYLVSRNIFNTYLLFSDLVEGLKGVSDKHVCKYAFNDTFVRITYSHL